MPTYPAWWNFYIPSSSGDAGVGAALAHLEVGLGLKMQARDISPTPSRTDDYRVDAWTYIEAPTVEVAAVTLLARIARIVKTIGQPFVFNPSQDDGTVAYYWDAPDERCSAVSRSSGVLLLTSDDGERVSAALTPEEQAHRHLDEAAPRITAAESGVSDWMMEIEVRMYSQSKVEAKEKRWPLFRSQLPGTWEVTTVRGGAAKALPYSIKARGEAVGASTSELIACFLQREGGATLDVALDGKGEIQTVGMTRADQYAAQQGIASYVLTRSPSRVGGADRPG